MSPTQMALMNIAAGSLQHWNTLQIAFPATLANDSADPYTTIYLLLSITVLVILIGVLILGYLKFGQRRAQQLREEDQNFTHARSEQGGRPYSAEAPSSHPPQRPSTSQKTATAVNKALFSNSKYVDEHEQPCRYCTRLVPGGSNYCPYCGNWLISAEEREKLRRKSSPLFAPDAPEINEELKAFAGRDTEPLPLPQMPSIQKSPTPAGSANDTPASKLTPEKVGKWQKEAQPGKASDEQSKVSGITVGAHSNASMRSALKVNQDNLFAAYGLLHTHAQLEPFGLFIIADGLTGNTSGQDASCQAIQTLIDRVLPELLQNNELEEENYHRILTEGVKAANRAIYQRNETDHTDIGTSLTAALVVGLRAFVVNVGDSRTYLYRASSGLRKITNDHSLVAYLIETGVIKHDDLYIHSGCNQVYRNLGAKPVLKVDLFIEQLQADDILLLCSDGLWEMAQEPVMQEILSSVPEPSQTSRTLITQAINDGCEDNASVIVARFAEAVEHSGSTRVQLLAKPDAVEMPGL